MISFVENNTDFQKLESEILDNDVIIIPIMDRHDIDSLIAFYIYGIDTDNQYLYNINHPDSINCSLDSFLNLESNSKAFILRKKKIFNFFNKRNFYDLELAMYWMNGQVKDTPNIWNSQDYNLFKRQNNDIDFNSIPISKLVEISYDIVENTINDLRDYDVTDDFVRYEKITSYIFYNLENDGIFTTNGMEYSDYNYYTFTGRPSNTNGNYNFSALNKSDGTREKFTTRFTDGSLLLCDYSAYHYRLVANLIDYNFPNDVNVHKYFADKFGIQDFEYDDMKARNFHALYGKMTNEHLKIDFFKKIDIYIKNLWKEFNSNGFIETIIFKRKLKKEFYENMNPSKLFNYLIQSYETEQNFCILHKITKFLRNKQTKIVLYTYDSLLFDYSIKDGNIVQDIKEIMESDGFPIDIQIGKNYQNMQKMLLD